MNRDQMNKMVSFTVTKYNENRELEQRVIPCMVVVTEDIFAYMVLKTIEVEYKKFIIASENVLNETYGTVFSQ